MIIAVASAAWDETKHKEGVVESQGGAGSAHFELVGAFRFLDPVVRTYALPTCLSPARACANDWFVEGSKGNGHLTPALR